MSGDGFDVFLSYNRSDGPQVAEIAQALRARGMKVFFDRDYLTAGRPWPELLEHSLSASKAVAICLGPQGLGPWQQREQYVALDRQAKETSLPVIPVLLPGAKDPPLGFLRLQTWIDMRATDGGSAGIEGLQRAILGKAPSALTDPAPDPRASVCPYRGLEPFREEDEAFFVGREAFTKGLIEKIRQRDFVGVVGASGSGKSSVVLAGLIPALRRRADGRFWEIGVIRPGQFPLRQLSAAFLPPEAGLDEFARIAKLKERAAQLANGNVKLSDVVMRVIEQQPGTDRLLLVVDQWEELYSHTKNEEVLRERANFLKVLLGEPHAAPVSIVVTLRGDFYGRALQDRALADRLQDAVVNISPMRREELARAVTEPAAKVGLSFEDGLVDQILNDVGEEPGNLPLMEFMLKELWDRRERDGHLTFGAYASTGGVRRAIAMRAENELQKLGPEQRAAARRFLVRLVSPGEGQADVRTQILIPTGDEAVRGLIDQFTQARLLTTGLDPATGREVVEVGHEALIREWETLKQWVNADREFLRTVERVKRAMGTWEAEGKTDDRLLPPGRPLEEARELLSREHAEIDDIRPFILASIARDDARVQKERQEREEDQRRQLLATNYRRLRVAAALMAVLALIAVGFGYNAYDSRLVAEAERIVAEAERKTADESRQQAETQRKIAEDRAVQISKLSTTNSVLANLLRTEYLQRFGEATIQPGKTDSIKASVGKLLIGRDQYEELGRELNIPWYFIGIIHGLEAGYDFTRHLHNGDPLSARTVRVPVGRPKDGEPPFKWKDSARDAMKMSKFDEWQDWSVAGLLVLWERTNGLGYRRHGVNSPYIWACTSLYSKGRYVGDGRFDPEAVYPGCGAVAFLKALIEERIVSIDRPAPARPNATVLPLQ